MSAPHAIAIGRRYADDSGWEDLLSVDLQTHRSAIGKALDALDPQALEGR